MIADTNPIHSAWACKFEKLDSRGHDNNVPCSPLGPRGTSQVELRGHVSNSCRLAITFCWWLWQREARSFPLIHEQNQKAPCKGGQIIGFAIEYHCPAWSPRGEAQPPISFKRDEDRT